MGSSYNSESKNHAIMVVYATAAPTSATIKFQGSNDGTNFVDMGETSDVSATTVGFACESMPFTYVRGNLTAVSIGSCSGITMTDGGTSL
jgi:hypothetical protein